MPRITLGVVIIAIAFYLIGAKWPMLAQRVGVA